MTSGLDAAFNFSDFQGLAALRRENAAGSPEARRAVAQQFEALFLNLMLRQMRASAVVEGGIFDHERLAMQESMLDQQLALTLARGSGSGLTRSILQALGESPASGSGSTERASPLQRGLMQLPIVASPDTAAEDDPLASAIDPVVVATEMDIVPESPQASEPDFLPESPQDFVEAVWPHAEQAARQLGTSPDVIVAQAALETGWGRSAIRDREGRHSFNLFGVKAAGNWGGPRAVVATIEFTDGVPEPRREPFRMYGSLAEGFDDYVTLIKGGRYVNALDADTPEDYVRGLQRAGYATDPDYADKILGILTRGLPGRSDQARASVADTRISMTEIDKRAGRGGS